MSQQTAWIENEVLKKSEIQNLPPIPKILTQFLEVVLPKLTLKPEVEELLHFYDNNDLRLVKTVKAYEQFPKDAEAFNKFIRIARSLEAGEGKTLDKTIPLYGLDSARNLVLLISYYININEMPFPWNEAASRPTVDPASKLSIAIGAYEKFAEDNRFAHRVFTAGLVYDFLRMYVEKFIKARTGTTVDYVERVYKHGARSAQILHVLSKKMKRLDLAEWALASAILHDVGKAIFAVLDPDYIDFATGLVRAKATRSVWIYAEEKKYGVSHPLLGYLICEAFPLLRPMAKAVLYHHTPYVLKAREQMNLYELTGTLSLSTNIVRAQLKIANESLAQSKYASDKARLEAEKFISEDVKRIWLRPELEEHELPGHKIHAIVADFRKSQ